ncbi:MAG: complex I NDUFA9 subunit family protein [Alphaproteobacteria bacterium]|nr:complex I NDUFA9 subunit family protein [Alphaproteobacteria bacterium]
MTIRRATVFGGSGFIGRYVVERLADAGVVVRIAVRHPNEAALLKPAGNVGQIVPLRAPVTDPDAVAAAVEGADWVINLVGILYQRGARTFAAIHHDGARNVAAAAAAAGVDRLVHVSALGADAKSPSEYARSKAAGEAAVHEALPSATVLRPSVVFGAEDDFINRFAGMARLSWLLPVVGAAPELPFGRRSVTGRDFCRDGGPKFQPVYVGDVADAVVRALEPGQGRGRTFELGGPEVLSMKAILELILRRTNRRRWLVPLPFAIARLQAAFLEYLPVPPLTRDQVAMLERDNVVAEGADTLADLGLRATPIEAVIDSYMDRYRAGGRFSRPRSA